jgi:transcriptional regulator with XRE-family HTH domain
MDHTLYNLKTLRVIRGLSVKEMASSLYICERQYRNIEAGKSPLSLDRLELIAKVLHVPIETFFVKTLKEQIWENLQVNHPAIGASN